MNRFGGATYDPELDHDRLSTQLVKVRDYLWSYSPNWFTLRELSLQLNEPEASVSARLRDLRKDKFGGHEIEARRQPRSGKRGTWEYRLLRPIVRGQGEMFR